MLPLQISKNEQTAQSTQPTQTKLCKTIKITSIVFIISAVIIWIIIGSLVATNNDTKKGTIMNDGTTSGRCSSGVPPNRRSRTCSETKYVWYEPNNPTLKYQCRNIVDSIIKPDSLDNKNGKTDGYYETVTTDCFIKIPDNTIMYYCGIAVLIGVSIITFFIYFYCNR